MITQGKGRKGQLLALFFCAMLLILVSSATPAAAAALVLANDEVATGGARLLTSEEKKELLQKAYQAVELHAGNRDLAFQISDEENSAQEYNSDSVASSDGSDSENGDDEEEEDDTDEPDSRSLATCKYDLKALAQYTIPAHKRSYEVIRQKKYNVGNGPLRFVSNNLPLPFKNSTCEATIRLRRLTFLWRPSRGDVRHLGACIGHWGTNEIESPAVAIYDCNGKQLACSAYDFLKYTHNAARQNLLIVVSPGSDKRPDAYKYIFQRRSIFSVWCDYFPFNA